MIELIEPAIKDLKVEKILVSEYPEVIMLIYKIGK